MKRNLIDSSSDWTKKEGGVETTSHPNRQRERRLHAAMLLMISLSLFFFFWIFAHYPVWPFSKQKIKRRMRIAVLRGGGLNVGKRPALMRFKSQCILLEESASFQWYLFISTKTGFVVRRCVYLLEQWILYCCCGRMVRYYRRVIIQ